MSTGSSAIATGPARSRGVERQPPTTFVLHCPRTRDIDSGGHKCPDGQDDVLQHEARGAAALSSPPTFPGLTPPPPDCCPVTPQARWSRGGGPSRRSPKRGRKCSTASAARVLRPRRQRSLGPPARRAALPFAGSRIWKCYDPGPRTAHEPVSSLETLVKPHRTAAAWLEGQRAGPPHRSVCGRWSTRRSGSYRRFSPSRASDSARPLVGGR